MSKAISWNNNPKKGRHSEVFQSLDKYLMDNIDNLTGKDITHLYFDFWNELKRWRSGSSGFTGYSEFLLFRVFIHSLPEISWTLCETKDCVGGNRKDTDPIIFKSTNLFLSQGKFFPLTPKRRFAPDICVYNKSNELKFIVEIKININGGSKQVDNILDKFYLVKEKHPDVRALHVTYTKSSYGPHKARLSNGWWKNTLLEEEDRLFSEVVRDAFYPYP